MKLKAITLRNGTDILSSVSEENEDSYTLKYPITFKLGVNGTLTPFIFPLHSDIQQSLECNKQDILYIVDASSEAENVYDNFCRAILSS